MKNRIFLLIVFLMMLCIPFSVYAETCDNNNVVIKNIEQTNKSEGTDEKTEATIENNKINLDISMSEVEDYIEYQFNVENKSDEDLVFNEKSLTSEDNHFNYEFNYEDNSNIIKSHTDKDVTLTITYARVIDESEFENGTYKIEDTNKIGVMNQELVNPKTSNYFAIIIKIILGIIIVFSLFQINNKYIKTLLLLLCLIPTTVYALCSYEMEICTNIEVSTIQGQVPVTDTIYWALQDNNNDGDYEKLIISNHEVTGSDNYQGSFAGNTEFADCNQVPWNRYDYFGGNSKNVEEIKIEGVVAPTSTVCWFSGIGTKSEVLDINLSNLNVSNVTNMNYMFANAGRNTTNTVNLNLSKWNTSNLVNVNMIFYGIGYNANTLKIEGLSEWDTSKITNMSGMFYNVGGNVQNFDIGDLSGWNTSNVTNMSSMFSYSARNTKTFDIGDISKWDISNVESIAYMFSGFGNNITTFNFDLSGWNTSKVTSMAGIFDGSGTNATTININFSGWDTSKVTDMSYMFNYLGYTSTTSFNVDLSGWNTSQVTYMNYMFQNTAPNATTWKVKVPSSNSSGITNYSSIIYGSKTSVNASPPNGKAFTLA